MYNIQKALGVEKNTNNFINAGIQENVTLSEIKVDTSVNGNSFIEFSFKKANSGSAPHTEWEPKKFPTETNEEFELKCSKQYARILQILLCYYTKEEITALNFNPSNFLDLANWTKVMLEKADREKLLRVKFVYNDKDFITLPKYAKYIFIEPMTISAEDSEIRLLSIDKIKRSIIADNEETQTPFITSGLNSVTVDSSISQNIAQTAASDMPF